MWFRKDIIMIDLETLQVTDYEVIEKVYDKEGELKGYVAEITLQTYIDRDFDWIYNLSERLDNFATKDTIEQSEPTKAQETITV